MLTERNRAVLHRRLTDVVGDEEAVSEMLSHFPNDEQLRPASESFVESRLEVTEGRVDAAEHRLDTKVDATADRLEAKIDATEHRLDTKIDATADRLEAKIDATGDRLDGRIEATEHRLEASFTRQTSQLVMWMVGAAVAVCGVVVAAVGLLA